MRKSRFNSINRMPILLFLLLVCFSAYSTFPRGCRSSRGENAAARTDSPFAHETENRPHEPEFFNWRICPTAVSVRACTQGQILCCRTNSRWALSPFFWICYVPAEEGRMVLDDTRMPFRRCIDAESYPLLLIIA